MRRFSTLITAGSLHVFLYVHEGCQPYLMSHERGVFRLPYDTANRLFTRSPYSFMNNNQTTVELCPLGKKLWLGSEVVAVEMGHCRWKWYSDYDSMKSTVYRCCTVTGYKCILLAFLTCIRLPARAHTTLYDNNRTAQHLIFTEI